MDPDFLYEHTGLFSQTAHKLVILLAALLEYEIHTVVYFCYNAPHRARQQFLTAQGSTEH